MRRMAVTMKTYENGQAEPELVVEDEAERSWMKRLGPGLITGAADDDPSGIATYTQAGAQFGFGLLWTMLLTYPLMVAIQSVSARLGRVLGRGLATNLRRHYPAPILYAAVMVLLVANTINIAADLAAMGAAAKLVLGGPVQLYVVLLGTASPRGGNPTVRADQPGTTTFPLPPLPPSLLPAGKELRQSPSLPAAFRPEALLPPFRPADCPRRSASRMTRFRSARPFGLPQ